MAEGMLSTEQVLLLENLMYLPNKGPFKSIAGCEGKSIGEYIKDIDINGIADDAEYGTFMTGKEWKNIIQAVKNDNTLMKVEIMTTHNDHAEGGGGGLSALFANPDTGEAVVAFKGTAGGEEWKDNFVGGGATNMPDGVSTQQQVNALEWYQSLELDQYNTVTVTGHSKGGNKAKYITLMDDSVDRCMSFDGQGFSDEFMDQYADAIAQRQDRIHNYNAEYDYVNELLNDVGDKTYYKGQNIGKGGFLENHCANTPLRFEEDGSCHMVPAEGQAEEIAVLDEFLNSYLRSVSPEKKQEALLAVGLFVEMFDAGASVNDILKTLSEGSYVDQLSYLLAYFIRYKQENPEFADAFRSILIEFDMPEFLEVVDMIDGITNWRYFGALMDILSLADDVPDWMLKQLAKYLEDEFGITLTTEELRRLLAVFENTNDYMDEIKVLPEGKDIKVSSSSFCSFSIKPDMIRDVPNDMLSISMQISAYQEELDSIAKQLKGSMGMTALKIRIGRITKNMQNEAKSFEKMGRGLKQIIQTYTDTENRIIDYASDK